MTVFARDMGTRPQLERCEFPATLIGRRNKNAARSWWNRCLMAGPTPSAVAPKPVTSVQHSPLQSGPISRLTTSVVSLPLTKTTANSPSAGVAHKWPFVLLSQTLIITATQWRDTLTGKAESTHVRQECCLLSESDASLR